MARASSVFLDEARSEEDLEVLGDGGTADGELGGQLSDWARPLGHQLEHSAAGRIGQGDQSVSYHLP